jgi:hypothetical protein
VSPHVRALGEVHGAHPPAPELAHDLVRPDAPSGERRGRAAEQPLGERAERPLPRVVVEQPRAARVLREQRRHLVAERRVAGARLVEVRGALGGRALGRRVEDALDLPPARRVGRRRHDARISRRSHARAARQSRSTVGTETPRTSAVSAP